MLRIEVFPLPDGPKRTVNPGPTANSLCKCKRPKRRSTRISKDMVGPAPCPAPADPFGKDHGEQRQDDANGGKPENARVAPRHLQHIIDSERQSAGLAGNVGNESDGRSELPNCASKSQH